MAVVPTIDHGDDETRRALISWFVSIPSGNPLLFALFSSPFFELESRDFNARFPGLLAKYACCLFALRISSIFLPRLKMVVRQGVDIGCPYTIKTTDVL